MLVASIVNLFKTNKTDKENSLKQNFCFDALFVCVLDLPDNGLVTNGKSIKGNTFCEGVLLTRLVRGLKGMTIFLVGERVWAFQEVWK